MQTGYDTPEPGEHLFSESDVFRYQDASSGQRFLNFLIDKQFHYYQKEYSLIDSQLLGLDKLFRPLQVLVSSKCLLHL